EPRPRGLPQHPVLVRGAALSNRRLGFAEELGVADGGAGAGPTGDHRALHARQHARGHPRRLHAHRASQGAGRDPRHLQARAQERVYPRGDSPGPDVRRGRERLGLRRLDLPRPRHGPLLRPVRARTRLAPLPYTKSNFGRVNEAPSRDYPLGTDQLGRDLLSRMIYGARVSMLVGLGAQVIVVLIGVPIGALSGYLGGRTDMFLTRFIDVMYAFPRLLFVILLMSMLGAGLTNIFIAIGLTGWVGIARQTRAQVLAIKQMEFVDGA